MSWNSTLAAKIGGHLGMIHMTIPGLSVVDPWILDEWDDRAHSESRTHQKLNDYERSKLERGHKIRAEWL